MKAFFTPSKASQAAGDHGARGRQLLCDQAEHGACSNGRVAYMVAEYPEPEVVAAVAGHHEETSELLKLPLDFIFFTGSTSTGKVVAQAAAENLTPVLLEQGGQNPALDDETANIPDAAKKIDWGSNSMGRTTVHVTLLWHIRDRQRRKLRNSSWHRR
jgi:Aldehyde dehydrogenase family